MATSNDRYCWMAINSLGCMSEKNNGYLGSTVVIDVAQLDLSKLTHTESMAEMIAVLQLASSGSFENRSKFAGQMLFPYILTR